ncbi:hypothetical protein SDC9_48876 [bioreactor metagenome]|uniref:Uncharacterized protein n=1 Tax=bioreactor metagenome TaxID=1076179 RepID=A0A644WFS0_9ZZZZ
MAFTRESLYDPEGRQMRVLIELHGGIYHLLLGVGKLLEDSMVTGHQSQSRFLQAVLQGCPCYCGTFNRIGTAPKFIQDYQRTPCHVGKYVGNLFHVSAEGGKLSLDGLLVPDIGIDIIKDGQCTALLCGNVSAELVEQGEQSHRLDGYRFSSGIRSADYHSPDVRIELHGDGNDLFAEQGVTRLDQGAVCNLQIGTTALFFPCPFCDGQPGIGLPYTKSKIGKFLSPRTNLIVELFQNFCDFDKNLVLCHHHGIIHLHQGIRFHEDGIAGRRTAGDETLHVGPSIAAYRNNQTAVTQCLLVGLHHFPVCMDELAAEA